MLCKLFHPKKQLLPYSRHGVPHLSFQQITDDHDLSFRIPSPVMLGPDRVRPFVRRRCLLSPGVPSFAIQKIMAWYITTLQAHKKKVVRLWGGHASEHSQAPGPPRCQWKNRHTSTPAVGPGISPHGTSWASPGERSRCP